MSIQWQAAGQYEDILYEHAEGIAKITINRPEVHNSFRPGTLDELADAFEDAASDDDIGVVLFTGAGGRAFCAGGDHIRRPAGSPSLTHNAARAAARSRARRKSPSAAIRSA